MRLLILFLVAIVTAASVCAQPREAANLLKNGDFSAGTEDWYIDTGAERNTTASVVEADAGAYRNAVRFVVQPQPGDPFWSVRLQQANQVALKKGDVIILRAWLRSPTNSKVMAFVSMEKQPFAKSPQAEPQLTPQWREYEFRGNSIEDFAPGEASVGFFFAYAPGTIEVAGVRLFSTSPAPQFDIQMGHSGRINAGELSPDGKTVISGGEDGMVRLWDAQSGAMLRVLNHQEPVRAVAVSPDGKSIAVTGSQVSLWDMQKGALHRVLPGDGAPILSAAFSSDGKTIVAVDAKGTTKIWDSQSGTQLRRWEEVQISPNYKMAARKAANPNTIELLDADTQELRHTLTGHANEVEVLTFSGDNKMLASGGKDGTVRLWDVQTGQLLAALESHTQAVRDILFSSDNKRIATWSADQTARLWNVEQRRLRHTFQIENSRHLRFSPDGRFFAAGGYWPSQGMVGMKVWDTQSGELNHTFNQEGADVRSMTFSPDSKTLLSGGLDPRVFLWNLQTGERRQLGQVRDTFIAVSPDGSLLACGLRTAGEIGEIWLWDTKTGQERGLITDHNGAINALAFSPDGKTLASSSSGGIHLWDVATGQAVRTVNAGPVKSICYSPDGNTLAAANWADKTITLWSVATGELTQTLTGHTSVMADLCFSSDGKTLVSAGMWELAIRWWDVATGELREVSPQQGMPYSVAFSPDGKLLASTDQGAGKIIFYDAFTRKVLREIVPSTAPIAVSFSPDSKTVAVGGGNGEIGLWDAAGGSGHLYLGRRPDGVNRAIFSPDGKRLFCSGHDGTVTVWNTQSGHLLLTFQPLPPQPNSLQSASDTRAIAANSRAIAANSRAIAANSRDVPPVERAGLSTFDYIAVTPEGYYLGSAQADRLVRFRLGSEVFPAECFQVAYSRPDMIERALGGEGLLPPLAFKGSQPPVVSWVTPKEGDSLNGETVTVTVQISEDSDVRDVAFLVNGMRVQAMDSDGRAIGAYSRDFTADAPVGGIPSDARRLIATLLLPRDSATIKVQVLAFDDDGLQSPRAERTFTRATTHTSRTGAGQMRGLLVGISQYRDAQLNLRFADKDALALAADLNLQRGLYQGVQMTTLANEQATAPNLKAALDHLVASVSHDDTAIVFLGGHGWRDTQTGDKGLYYFATHEVDRNNIASTALPWSEIVQRLTLLSEKSHRVVVLLDTCHSGSAATNEELVKAILKSNAGVLIFASSRGSEISLESAEWQHGAFTKALREAMAGEAVPADEKYVPIMDFIAYVSRRVRVLTQNQQHPQVPFLQDFNTDAALVARP